MAGWGEGGVRPFLPDAGPEAARAILGAMRGIALGGGGTLTEAAARALRGMDRYIFGHDGPPLDPAALPEMEPEALARALAGTGLAEEAVRFLTVMAMVDGPPLDPPRLAAVLRHAEALGVHARFLDEIAAAAEGRLAEALADMTRANLESLTGEPWPEDGDLAAWALPYRGAGADPGLAARFTALGELPPESFGHALWAHFRANGYAFPGDPEGLNAVFSVPHDSIHVLTGYDTSPRGEILASTFTAAMHRRLPMAGHVLPVLLSWHLGVRLNDVAKDAKGGLDPEEFWRAWAGGAAMAVDLFDPGWDFWAHASTPLDALRRSWGIVPEMPGGAGVPPEPAAPS
jgi:hypothetical protein